jgi:hypothetical protein
VAVTRPESTSNIGLSAPTSHRRGISQERVAWFWTDSIVPRLPVPAWVAALLLFACLNAVGVMLASLHGELDTYIRDVRWPASYFACALSGAYLAYLPREVARLWQPLQPWLVDPDAKLSKLKSEGPRVLASFFWPSVAIWSIFAIYWTISNSYGDRYESANFTRTLNATYLSLLVYFVGAASSIATIGMWRFVRLISRTLDFEAGKVQQGKAALRPLARLLLFNWLFYLVLTLSATLTATPLSNNALRPEDLAVWVLITPYFILLLHGQLALNGLLAQEKAVEVARLRHLVEHEAALPENANELTVLRSMHRFQVLLHDLQQAESFNPNFIDTRFVVQIALSVTAILLANVLLRTLLAGLLPQ